ncbi:hypothetical protein Hanom_Chr07g00601501 [Helianthus anomalus]
MESPQKSIYYFRSAEHSGRPIKKFRIRPRNKASTQLGNLSPNSENRPMKCFREKGEFTFDLNLLAECGQSDQSPRTSQFTNRDTRRST